MMTYEEAKQRLSEMESRFDDGFSSLDRMYLDSLYFALFGKEITNKGCSNCYRDAFIEISVKLKKIKDMPKKSEFVLKAGAVITFFGEPRCYTNANMTDEAALRFLSNNPRNECLFEKLPANWKERIGLPADAATSEEASEKDKLIAQLTAENELLKQENEALKAGSSSKKRSKKKVEAESVPVSPASDPEASSTTEAPTAGEESPANEEQPSDIAPSVDSEVSVEEADGPAVEE